MIYWIWQQTQSEHRTRTGGAERTDEYVIAHAPCPIMIVDPRNFAETQFTKHDLLILSNNCDRFTNKQRDHIFKFRHVLYNHDTGGDKRGWMSLYEWYPKMYEKSLLNIFLSPAHWKAFDSPKNSICNPPYFEERFKDLGMKRVKNSVCFLGNFHYKHKGAENVAKYAKEHPELTIDIYSSIWDEPHERLFQNISNVHLQRKLEYEEIPKVLNHYEYFIHLPNWVEAFGRSCGEAFLCGCKPIVNERVGAMSFEWSYDIEEFRKQCELAPKIFWEHILDLY